MIDFTRDDILVDYEDFTVRVNQRVESVELPAPLLSVRQKVWVAGQWRYKAADLYVAQAE